MSALKPTFTITNAIAGHLTTIERARGFLDAATLSQEWIQRMADRAMVLEAHPEINRRTLQRDMRRFFEIGLVSPEGATNKLYYRFKDNVL